MHAPDPYDAVRALALSLENEGHSPDVICDALVCIGLNAGCRLAGEAAVVGFLHRMIEVYSAGPERQAPPSRTQ